MSDSCKPVVKVCQKANFNLYIANPFDSRKFSQFNQWCSNDLILKDKNLRCLARVNNLDVVFDRAVSKNMSKY